MKVNEIFGPTIQGEGPSAGHRAVFIRSARCNLTCTWCDTPYTWDWANHDPAIEIHDRTTDIAYNQAWDLAAEKPAILVITGGEPLIQGEAVAELCYLAAPPFTAVEIETNGTRPLPRRVSSELPVWFNVSPKLANSGCPPGLRALHGSWGDAGRSARYKFVVSSPVDLYEVRDIVTKHSIDPGSVWLMAEGATQDEQAQRAAWVMETAVDHGFNYSPRLHVLAWGNRRGT